MEKAERFFIKIALAFRSKTAWTVALLAVYNGVSSVKDMVPAPYQELVNALLGIAAVYFRMNPSATLNNTLDVVSGKK
jgi:hypothetical protein